MVMSLEEFMNDDQLVRSLQSIGKACFVEYFEMFANSSISNEDLIDILMKKENYMESGAKTRVSQSRRIINSGRAKDALKIVSSSNKIPYPISTKARELASSL